MKVSFPVRLDSVLLNKINERAKKLKIDRTTYILNLVKQDLEREENKNKKVTIYNIYRIIDGKVEFIGTELDYSVVAKYLVKDNYFMNEVVIHK